MSHGILVRSLSQYDNNQSCNFMYMRIYKNKEGEMW